MSASRPVFRAGVPSHVEAQAPAGPRWIALDAKFAIQHVDPIAVPRALSLQLPDVREVWLVTPGGDEARLSESCVQTPIRRLADRLRKTLAGV